jgi:hypothetical protein
VKALAALIEGDLREREQWIDEFQENQSAHKNAPNSDERRWGALEMFDKREVTLSIGCGN